MLQHAESNGLSSCAKPGVKSPQWAHVALLPREAVRLKNRAVFLLRRYVSRTWPEKEQEATRSVLYFTLHQATICCGSGSERGECRMNEENKEAQEPSWQEAHPWLSQLTSAEDDDSVDEVIRYTLDELRFA